MPENYPTHLWEPLEIPTDKHLLFRLGGLSVRIDSSDGEMRLQFSRDEAVTHAAKATIESGEPEFTGSVEYFACQEAVPVIRAKPILPDRSIVVRPEKPQMVLPGEQTLFFVSIPVWIQFELVRPKPVAFKTLPVVVRSATWYGDPMSGEHCYAEKSSAAKALNRIEPCDWQVICPITIRNRAATSLEVKRLCIQVRHLGIFQGQERLWTHPAAIVYEEGLASLKADYEGKAPTWEPIIRTLCEPRDPARKSLLNRGLSTLRLPGF